MIKILIADDHQIVVDGLVSLLTDENDITVVDTANSGKAALEIIAKQEIDIAVLDINMPEMDGVEATSMITQSHPNTKVLVLSMYDTDDYIEELIYAGCSGYILKNMGQEEFVSAIRKISEGEQYFGKTILKKITAGLKRSKQTTKAIPVNITAREKDVIRLIAKGMSSAEIAKELFISETTVNTHSRNAKSKLNIKNLNGLIRYAFENGLAD